MNNAEVDDVLDALREHFSDALTSWETDFVASVGEQWERNGRLSERQLETLDQVFERVSRGGTRGRA